MAQNINVNVTVNAGMAPQPVAYVPIADDDYETAKFYESNGVAVRTITLNGKPNCFALVEVDTQAQADMLNREFNRMRKQEQRSLQRRMDNEVSFDKLVDDGFDSAVDYSDPSDIIADIVVTKALFKELNKLTDEKLRICQMVGQKKSEREMATELGIPQTTLHDRKAKLLKELASVMNNYR